ncbi:MAG: hypothetical protein GY696_09790 [Gammaproteobacteria bacterium]|nr:hypothetical protein [Gammaproteobacteria bacterium]
MQPRLTKKKKKNNLWTTSRQQCQRKGRSKTRRRIETEKRCRIEPAQIPVVKLGLARKG